MSRVGTATALGLREQGRRPLAIALLIVVPVVFITRAVARTEPVPRSVPLPGGGTVLTTMRELHGATMAAITVAFLAGLAGVFAVQPLRQADRRLTAAGFRPWEIVVPRLAALAGATAIVLLVSLVVTALSFNPADWPAFALATALTAVTAALVGALTGLVARPLPATYLLLFWAMLDLGIAQNPMFGTGAPPAWAAMLPGWGPGRLLVDGAFSNGFGAPRALALSLAWIGALAVGLVPTLRRLLGTAG
jgi:hypothetical protein